MNRKMSIAFLALSTLGVASRAVGQTTAIEATVPFEFTVGGKLLPADTYILTSTSPGVIQIESADLRHWAKTISTHGYQQSTDGSKLVFDKYEGGKYFLHEVLCPSMAKLNVAIPTSKLEKQVQVQEAKYGGAPEVVLVASR